MTKIEFKNGGNGIYNEVGYQAKGSFAAGKEGLNPRELLEASLGLCVSLTLRSLLERDGLLKDDTEIFIEADAVKDTSGANKFTHFDIKVKMPEGLDDDYRKKALIMIERGCTIGNTLKSTCTIETIEY